MNKITIQDLLDLVKSYNPNEVEVVKKAYELANLLHANQYRESGEPYIIHPINVAYTLATLHADRDTLCAALLHDTLEDTNLQKEEIRTLFNDDVANLVDGVTKLSNIEISSKEARKLANTRKIITSISEDVRIIFIKLADRLHNMQTLGFKNEAKQKAIALETLEIFVPIAYCIGTYRIKHELEDLSLKYLRPYDYKRIEEIRLELEHNNQETFNEMIYKIKSLLKDRNIPNELKTRVKNIYGIYKIIELKKDDYKLLDSHDLLTLKIIVDEVENCYRTLYLVHSNYPPINERFKDYICNPKTNMYKSLHTVVFGPNDHLVQAQIRTVEMDASASFGLTSYWDAKKDAAKNSMQSDLKEKYQFFKSLTEINNMYDDNRDFIAQVKSELFVDKIYVYTTKGDIIELPKGSTPIDFAYKIHTEIGNSMVGVEVNDQIVPMNYQLKNQDRVKIITNKLKGGPKSNWLDIVQTSYAKRKIKDFNK